MKKKVAIIGGVLLIIAYIILNFKKNITDIHNEVEKSEIMK